MIEKQNIPSQSEIIYHVNQIAAVHDPETFFDQILTLIMDITSADASMLHLCDTTTNTLLFKMVKGIASMNLLGTHIPFDNGIPGKALQDRQPVFVPDIQNVPYQDQAPDTLPELSFQSVYCLPLFVGNQPIGIIQAFNPDADLLDGYEANEFFHMVGILLAPHIDRVRQLVDSQERERRLKDLADIMSRIASTLERDQLLDDIMAYTQDLLEVEATSIWIKDEKTGELILHVATGERRDQIREIRVPADHGIIGNVTSTGTPVIVNDVSQDAHFYSGVDQKSGFTTRSIMCVPLRAPVIQLGGMRGEIQEAIIGGAQALNKSNGRPFSEDDAVLFEMLASQSATILQISELYDQITTLYQELMMSYNETRKMFHGFINGITSFIDRKDPYTRGHSQRVADFSVAVATQMNLPDEMIHHIRIGGIIHDVGKIGVADDVLKKPGRLDDDEMGQMKKHPTYGIELLSDADLLRLLPIERQAIEEHHERLDGTGYPRGLRGVRERTDGTEDENGISLIGRIVAVADFFDALTSDRPYREALPVDEVLDMMQKSSGTHFDPVCVEALIEARNRGRIKTQRERPEYKRANGR